MAQYDLNGNVIPQKLCACGCGEPVYNGHDYVHGHNNRDPSEEVRAKMSKSHIERWNDPEYRKMMLEIRNDPEYREKQSIITKQHFIDNPEAGEAHSEFMIEYWNDPVNCLEMSNIMKQYFSDPEALERSSAAQQGQDYDAGEWTGFYDKRRPHVLPFGQCLSVNDWFVGSEGHHITKSIVAFLPAELHRHIKHNLKTGWNMGEMNALAIQFINGGL